MNLETAAVRTDKTGRPAASDGLDGDDRAAFFVWGCWAFLMAQALVYVFRHGSKTPYIEDWYGVDLLTGRQPFSLSWLWEQVPRGDHRVPIFKVLFYLDFMLFGVNVRPFLYLSLGLFGALSAGLMWAARRARGTTSFADAFFPVLLLNLGQGEVFQYAESAVYVICTSLLGVFLIVQVVWGPRLRPAPALAAGLCLVALPLTFGGGVTYVPFLALWMALTGYRLSRSKDPIERRAGLICLSSAVAASLVVAAYLTGYHRTHFDENESVTSIRLGPVQIIKASLKYLSMALGPAARRPFWPYSGVTVAALILAYLACVAAPILGRKPGRRDTAMGLALFAAGYLVTCLAVGVSRGSWDADYLFLPRYAASSVPILFGVYFAWECFGPPRWKSVGRMTLFTIAASNLTLNNNIGSELAWREEGTLRFQRDVQRGLSIPRLVSNYASITHHDHEKIEAWLEDLRDFRIGEYRNLPPDPRFREVRLPLTPSATHNVEWDGKAGRAIGSRPFLVFDLDKPEFVCGLRIKYSSTNPEGLNPYFQVFTHKPGSPPSFGKDRYFHVDLPTGHEVDVPVWLYKTIDRIRIHPDKRPCAFTISEIVLLLPDSDSERIPSAEDSPEGLGEEAGDSTDPANPKP